MELSEKIVALRKAKGWSQEELAEQLDVSRQSVSKWELGTAIPDPARLMHMSELLGVSTDYLLKNTTEDEATLLQQTAPGCRIVTIKEAETYLTLYQRVSQPMATAIAMLVLSPVALFVLAGLSGYQLLSEQVASVLGLTILLLVVAIAVAVLINYGLPLQRYAFLDTDPVSVQEGALQLARQRKQDGEEKQRKAVVTGVTLCILSPIPLILAALLEQEGLLMFTLALLLAMVAAGVYPMLRTGFCYGCASKLLQEGDYTQENKRKTRRVGWFPPVWWCTCTAVYLAFSFYTNRWDITWIVWPVGALLFVGIWSMLRGAIK